MNILAQVLLDGVDWASLRACCSTAGDVPDSVRRLLAATTKEERHAAYWSLDNHVVVQGNLYESGPPLVPVLLALLLDDLSADTRSDISELLVQLCAYGSHESEVEAGNPHLEEASLQHLREGKWVLYQLLLQPESSIRDDALCLLDLAETDRERLAEVFAAVAASDPDPRVVNSAKMLLTEIRQAG